MFHAANRIVDSFVLCRRDEDAQVIRMEFMQSLDNSTDDRRLTRPRRSLDDSDIRCIDCDINGFHLFFCEMGARVAKDFFKRLRFTTFFAAHPHGQAVDRYR